MKKINCILFLILAGFLVLSFCQTAMAGSGKININTAPAEELMLLKHVGDKIAEKIMEYRKAHPFEVPEDIMKVKGIGQKVFDVNKDMIIVKDD